jgi:hypothetical protein
MVVRLSPSSELVEVVLLFGLIDLDDADADVMVMKFVVDW